MELSVFDRVMLLNILPESGDILTLRIVRKLREELSFTEAELAEFELTHNDGYVQWNKEKVRSKNVEFGAKAKKMVRDALTEKSKNKQLTEQYVEIFDRFVDEEDEA